MGIQVILAFAAFIGNFVDGSERRSFLVSRGKYLVSFLTMWFPLILIFKIYNKFFDAKVLFPHKAKPKVTCLYFALKN